MEEFVRCYGRRKYCRNNDISSHYGVHCQTTIMFISIPNSLKLILHYSHRSLLLIKHTILNQKMHSCYFLLDINYSHCRLAQMYCDWQLDPLTVIEIYLGVLLLLL
jgi:hypothetical protein